jgi:hypothetical protein
MGLTAGDPLPNITTTKTTGTSGPDWYNTYLESLAKPGTNLLNLKPEEMVAGFDPLQQNVLDTAKGALSGYQSLLNQAGTDAKTAAKGITPESIQQFMNPYQTSVTNEMARQSNQNFQRNMMPALTGQFVGTGGAGSQRALGALGQMTADVNQNLTGAVNKSLADAYNSALGAAGAQAGLMRQGAEVEKGIASADLENTMKQLAAQYGYGENAQKLAQQRILAPLSAATTAGNVYANLKVPSTVSETANAPIPGAYSTPLLSQVTGLGSLFSSPTGGQSPASGFTNWLFGSGTPGQAGNTGGVLGDLKSWYNTNFGTGSGGDSYTQQGGTLTGSGVGGDN